MMKKPGSTTAIIEIPDLFFNKEKIRIYVKYTINNNSTTSEDDIRIISYTKVNGDPITKEELQHLTKTSEDEFNEFINEEICYNEELMYENFLERKYEEQRDDNL